MSGLLDQHKSRRQLTTLVENRTIYSAEYAELNIYETHVAAEKVMLTFDFPIIASMLTGKKIMHLEGIPSFDFLPGESLVLPSQQKMIIDFPIATQESPTQCLALGIDANKINEVAEKFNQAVRIEEENNDWAIHDLATHLTNNIEVNYLLERLITTFVNNNKSKDILLDLMIQELIIRLLQTNAKQSLICGCDGIFSDTRIGMVIKYIKDHLTEKNMSVDGLAKMAQMSTSNFHKKFKNTLGVSPVEYINSEKIKFAKKLMKARPNSFISEVAYKSGFNNVSYFNRQFKKMEMITPQQFKHSLSQ
jgi:AraC-like DNA-binding protein